MTRGDVIFYTACGGALLLLAGLFGWAWFQAARQDASGGADGVVERFMQWRSQATADIGEGLDSGDVRRVERGVARLREVSLAQSWHFSEGPYGDSAEVFREVLDQLTRDVEDGDLAAAKDTYARLTDSCQACHGRAAPTEQ